MASSPSFLFFPVNGSGMGHLTRCLAYARRLRDRAACVFFSLSSAMEFVEEMGFAGEYFVSPFWSVNSTYAWNCELAVRFGMLLERVRPDVVVFDGTWPFQGFLAACKAYGQPLKLVWSNRGLLKQTAKQIPVDKALFDLLIHPGELGAERAEELTEEGVPQLTVPPVLLLDSDEVLSRDKAREQLGLPQDGRWALFSLGPGNLKDVSGPGLRLIREMQAAGYAVVWACAPISVRDVELPATVQPLSVYPLARYLRAFDLFVGAAGYNTCCEVAQARIPSLIVPNTLLADDQGARAHLLARHAPVVVSACETDGEAREAVRQLLDLTRHGTPGGSEPLALHGAGMVAEALLALAAR